MAEPELDLAHAAVLSMDLQRAIVGAYAKDQADFLPRVASVLSAARAHAVPIIHVQVGFRAGFPEIDPRHPLFGAIKSSPQWQRMFEGPAGAIHQDVAPVGDEVVITKHRVSAFHGTDLEMILRAQRIDTLILCGIATSGVVLSTLLHASDADYRLVVVKDCCLDNDAEAHACMMDKVFARRAAIVTAEELRAALGKL